MPPNFCTFGLTWSARCEFFGAFSPVPEAERSEEHTSELQSRLHLVCRLLLEKKKINKPSIRADPALAHDGIQCASTTQRVNSDPHVWLCPSACHLSCACTRHSARTCSSLSL